MALVVKCIACLQKRFLLAKSRTLLLTIKVLSSGITHEGHLHIVPYRTNMIDRKLTLSTTERNGDGAKFLQLSWPVVLKAGFLAQQRQRPPGTC